MSPSLCWRSSGCYKRRTEMFIHLPVYILRVIRDGKAGLEITLKMWVSLRKTSLRNWVSPRFLGFPKMLSQSLLTVHYDFCYIDMSATSQSGMQTGSIFQPISYAACITVVKQQVRISHWLSDFGLHARISS